VAGLLTIYCYLLDRNLVVFSENRELLRFFLVASSGAHQRAWASGLCARWTLTS